MSGGHFNYNQQYIEDIANDIQVYLGQGFSQETLTKFKEAVYILRKAEIMAQRIDWLLSGDDGEETFHKRWKEDLGELWEETYRENNLEKMDSPKRESWQVLYKGNTVCICQDEDTALTIKSKTDDPENVTIVYNKGVIA